MFEDVGTLRSTRNGAFYIIQLSTHTSL